MESPKRIRKKFLDARQYFVSRQKTLAQSFNWAIEGIVFAVKTQRNMKYHFTIAFLVLLASLFFDLTRIELIAVLFAIAFVISAELINTAIEVAVDLAGNENESELAKIAKDVSAAAVLVAALNSVFVGFLVFFKKFSPLTKNIIQSLSRAPEYISGIAIIITFGAAIGLKVFIGEGTPARGGWPSVHSALAGALFAAISIISANFLVGTLAFFLALLVLQSRVEKNIHSWFEVVSGILLGMFTTILLFQIFYF